MEATRSESFVVFSATLTLQDLADKVADLANDNVEFVIIESEGGQFGVLEVGRINDNLERLEIPDGKLGDVKLGVLLQYSAVRVEAKDLSASTAREIDRLVDAKKRMLGLKGTQPNVIYYAAPLLGTEVFGGTPIDMPGPVFFIDGSDYTTKYCPYSDCQETYRVLTKVDGKGVCPNCEKEVIHCPHCGIPYAPSEEEGQSGCPDCGKGAKDCPHCRQPYLISMDGKSTCLHCGKDA